MFTGYHGIQVQTNADDVDQMEFRCIQKVCEKHYNQVKYAFNFKCMMN